MNDMDYTDIDQLYIALGIQNNGKVPKKILNTGTLERKLNTDYSAVIGNRPNTTWSNSAEMSK